MKIGKLSESALKKIVLEQLQGHRDEVIVGPGIGEDCTVLQLQVGEFFVASTDPITGTTKDVGTLAVHITANDLAASGAEPVGLLVTALLPVDIKEYEIKAIIQDMNQACESLSMVVLGGHTEITASVNQPVLSVTGIGKSTKEQLMLSKNANPGEDIVITKDIGLEGTAIIAREKWEQLSQWLPKSFLEEAKDCLKDISVVKEGMIGREYATSMHDITEGGIYGALWELSKASGVGIGVTIEDIPVRQQTIELCERFDLNPYQLISSGSMLMTSNDGTQLVQVLEEAGVKATIIGQTTDNNDKIIYRQGKAGNLEAPKQDELYKIYESEE